MPDAEERSSAPPIAPAAAFAPVRNDSTMGLMSGRGLY